MRHWSQGKKVSPPTTEARGLITLPAYSTSIPSYSACKDMDTMEGEMIACSIKIEQIGRDVPSRLHGHLHHLHPHPGTVPV